MAHKATHQHTDPSSTQVPVVLFGVDQNGKPKAARFVEKHADLAAKAAAHLNLHVLPIVGSAVADLAGRLPAGRIHANGRGFVPTSDATSTPNSSRQRAPPRRPTLHHKRTETCLRTGTTLAQGTWSSPNRARTMVGSRQLSSTRAATC